MDTALLKHVPLFVSLPPSALADMAVSFQETRYSAGAVLFREGDYGDRFYILLDGQIAIIKALGSDDERLLGLRGAGEFVGEMSLLSQDGLRTASVRLIAAAPAALPLIEQLEEELPSGDEVTLALPISAFGGG